MRIVCWQTILRKHSLFFLEIRKNVANLSSAAVVIGASVQFDQHLCHSLIGKYHNYLNLLKQLFNFPVRFWSWGDWFESCFVGNPWRRVLPHQGSNASTVQTARKHGSSVVSPLASGARGPRFDPPSRRGKFRSLNTLSLVSFAGMTLDKCIVLRIGTLTGCPLCRESHPLCRLKNPIVI